MYELVITFRIQSHLLIHSYLCPNNVLNYLNRKLQGYIQARTVKLVVKSQKGGNTVQL